MELAYSNAAGVSGRWPGIAAMAEAVELGGSAVKPQTQAGVSPTDRKSPWSSPLKLMYSNRH